MKPIRKATKSSLSKIFISCLAALFVLSLSSHSHAVGIDIDAYGLTSHDHDAAPGHSSEYCSTCLLQGNLQIPLVDATFNDDCSGSLIAYIDLGFLIPCSFLTLNKPSRSPPIG